MSDSTDGDTAPRMRRYKPCTQILRGTAVAVAGNLGTGWADSDVARWMGYNGGRFVGTLAEDGRDRATHVLCTMEEYLRGARGRTAAQKKTKADLGPPPSRNLQRALARGPRGIHVVLRDWLEDSLHKRRRLRERPYLLRQIVREQQQSAEAQQQRAAEHCERGRQLAETFVDTSLYRIYRDCTGFAYKATIRRDHEPAGIVGERYVLYLFESLAKPRLYWFAARHYKSRAHTKPRNFRPSDTCQLFAAEFAHFCAFFRKKTGVAWDARLVGESPAARTSTAQRPMPTAAPHRLSTADGEPLLPMVANVSIDLQDEGGDAGRSTMPGYFVYEKPVSSGQWKQLHSLRVKLTADNQTKGMPLGAIENEKNLPQEVKEC